MIEGKYVLGICIGVFLTGFAIGAMTEYFNHLDEPVECPAITCTLAEKTGDKVRIPTDQWKFIGNTMVLEAEDIHEKQLILLEKIYCLDQLYAHNNKDLCDT